METDDFEWGDVKAASNLKGHGVSFEAATLVFEDKFIFEGEDDRFAYDEYRAFVIGMAEGRLLYVVYTLRGERIRLISARGATPLEQEIYKSALAASGALGEPQEESEAGDDDEE